MMWKIQQAKQKDAEFIRRIHPALKPVTGLKCSCGKILRPSYQDPGWKNRNLDNRANPPSDMNTSEVRRDLGDRDHMKRLLLTRTYLLMLTHSGLHNFVGGISRRNPTVA